MIDYLYYNYLKSLIPIPATLVKSIPVSIEDTFKTIISQKFSKKSSSDAIRQL